MAALVYAPTDGLQDYPPVYDRIVLESMGRRLFHPIVIGALS